MNVQHLPYQIDPASNRFYFYENYWKRVALQLLQKHAGSLQGLTLLDYGCGRGETLAYAKEMGLQAEGLDVDPECVRLARAHGPAEILDLKNPLRQAPPRSYDVVACFHVLEHVDNPKEILTMLGRACRRYCLVAVPNLSRFPNLRRPWQSPEYVNTGHLQSWDHPHFKTLAEVHCGLRVVDWGFDATIISPLSEMVKRLFGNRVTIGLETGLFRRLFPYWGISVIALLTPVPSPSQNS